MNNIHQIKHLCYICGKELNRFEVIEKLCGLCKAKKIAKKIEDAVRQLIKENK